MRRNFYSSILLPFYLPLLIISGCNSDDGDDFDSFLGADSSISEDSSDGSTTGSSDDISAEGLWRGITDTGRAVSGVVLDDDTYWFIYSSIGNFNVIAGVAQGNGISAPDSNDSGFFNSYDGRDFNFEGLGVSDFTLDSFYWALNSIVPSPRFDGSINYSSSTTTFESSYDFNYDSTPSLTDIAGTYDGAAYTSGGPDSATVTITNAGTVDGSGASGCLFSGSVMPRTSGNIYDISITFGGGVCANGTDTVTGVAYYYAPTKEFTSVGLNATRTDGFIYVGIQR